MDGPEGVALPPSAAFHPDSGEMPSWKSGDDLHSVAWALKIKTVIPHPDGAATLTFVRDEYGPMQVSKDFNDTHEPKAGEYYVVRAAEEGPVTIDGVTFESRYMAL